MDSVFSFFDKDGDGQISYQDFVQSIGYEIHPSETLYFRQDKADAIEHKDQPCDQEGCWSSVSGRALWCLSHLKQNQEKILRLYTNIHSKIIKKDPKNWTKFMLLLDRQAMHDDKSLIKINDLLNILGKFRLKLSDKQIGII